MMMVLRDGQGTPLVRNELHAVVEGHTIMRAVLSGEKLIIAEVLRVEAKRLTDNSRVTSIWRALIND